MSHQTRYSPLLSVRNYHSKDFECLRKLKIELEKKGPFSDPWSLKDLEESITFSNRFSKSNVFVTEWEGDIIAFLKLKPEMDIRRVVLTLIVHPRYRNESVLLSLMERAIIRAKELKAERVHINLPRGHKELKNVLLKGGFHTIRRYLELRLDLSKINIPKDSRKVVRTRPFKRGEEDWLTFIQNRAFNNTWGYSSNTTRDIIHRTSLFNFSPQNVLFALDDDRLVGYCWTMTFPPNRVSSKNSGRILMIGVDPEQQGKGIGKQLLLAGLSYLKGKGIRIVDLTVDSENGAARTLYKSVGFRHRISTLWFEKSLV